MVLEKSIEYCPACAKLCLLRPLLEEEKTRSWESHLTVPLLSIPQIVYDPATKRWVDKDAGPDDGPQAPAAPPSDSQLMGGGGGGGGAPPPMMGGGGPPGPGGPPPPPAAGGNKFKIPKGRGESGSGAGGG